MENLNSDESVGIDEFLKEEYSKEKYKELEDFELEAMAKVKKEKILSRIKQSKGQRYPKSAIKMKKNVEKLPPKVKEEKAATEVQLYKGHTGIFPYKCPECRQAFSTSGQLNFHGRAHITRKSNSSKPKPGQPFQCAECFKPYSLENNLIRHMRIHT